MRYAFWLTVALVATWLFWSGHFDNPFLLGLGALSVLVSLYVSLRMDIVDEEGAPAQLGIRPFVFYAPWLAKEIVESNLAVAKIILSRKMKLKRNMVTIKSHQKCELGRVILANSITLTPGTVSVQMKGEKILIHGLNLEETEEDMSGEMDERICRLEKSK
ncbi:Na+/H+ antiporter subunit E [Rhodopirellula bahusiensis]|uniref:Na+/H+ antiporter subunit E n=2 Tax=Rhodopirellula bahusiensis TaxID=2014065 RepID=UPI0032652243